MATLRPSAPATLADLRRELEEKERALQELVARQQALADEVDALGATLQAMLRGGASAPGRRREAPPPRSGRASVPGRKSSRGAKRAAPKGAGDGAREGSLVAFIRSILEQVVGPLRVGEICSAVQEAGYSSKSDNLGIIVANRLAQMDDVERVERGLYQLRRADAAVTVESAIR
jgi:hypothetical protein